MYGLRPALAPAVLALWTAAPAAAEPVLEALSPCYVSARTRTGFATETVAYSGSGFVPGSAVAVTVDGEPVGPPIAADAVGAVSGTFFAPGVGHGQRSFTVVAAQTDDPTSSAAASSLVTNLTARVRPVRAAPRTPVTFSGRGFTDTTAPLYAHYALGRHVETVRLAGPPKDACGVFSVRRPQFPFKPAPGRWTIRVDQSARVGARTPAVAIDVRVRRIRK